MNAGYIIMASRIFGVTEFGAVFFKCAETCENVSSPDRKRDKKRYKK